MLIALLNPWEHLLPPREPPPLLPPGSQELPLLLQSGSLKSRGPVVVTASAGVHDCHAAEVAMVTAMAPSLEEYCLGRNPGACTHPLFLLFPPLPPKVPPVPLIGRTYWEAHGQRNLRKASSPLLFRGQHDRMRIELRM